MKKYQSRQKSISISQKVKQKFRYSPSFQAQKLCSKIQTKFNHSLLHNANPKNIHKHKHQNSINCQYSSVKQKNLDTNQCNDTSSWIAKLVNGIQDDDEQNKNFQKLSHIQNRSISDLPQDSDYCENNQFLMLKNQNLFKQQQKLVNNKQKNENKRDKMDKNIKKGIKQKTIVEYPKMNKQQGVLNKKQGGIEYNNNKKKSIKQVLSQIQNFQKNHFSSILNQQSNQLQNNGNMNSMGIRGPPATRQNSVTRRQSNNNNYNNYNNSSNTNNKLLSKRNSCFRLSPKTNKDEQRQNNENKYKRIQQGQQNERVNKRDKKGYKSVQKANNIGNKNRDNRIKIVTKSKSVNKDKRQSYLKQNLNLSSDKKNIYNSNAILKDNNHILNEAKIIPNNQQQIQSETNYNDTSIVFHQDNINLSLNSGTKKYSVGKIKLQNEQNRTRKNSFILPEQLTECKEQFKIVKQHCNSLGIQNLFSQENQFDYKKNQNNSFADAFQQNIKRRGGIIKKNKIKDQQNNQQGVKNNQITKCDYKGMQRCLQNQKQSHFQNSINQIQEKKGKSQDQSKYIQTIRQKINPKIQHQTHKLQNQTQSVQNIKLKYNYSKPKHVEKVTQQMKVKDKRISVHLQFEDFPSSFRTKAIEQQSKEIPQLTKFKRNIQPQINIRNSELQIYKKDDIYKLKANHNRSDNQALTNIERKRIQSQNRTKIRALFNKLKLDESNQILQKSNLRLRGLSCQQKQLLGNIITKIHYQNLKYDFQTFYAQFTQINANCSKTGCFSQQKLKNSNQSRGQDNQCCFIFQNQSIKKLYKEDVNYQRQAPLDDSEEQAIPVQRDQLIQNHSFMGHRRRNSKIIKKKLFEQIRKISHLQKQAMNQLQKNLSKSHIQMLTQSQSLDEQPNYIKNQQSYQKLMYDTRQLASNNKQYQLMQQSQINQNISKEPYILNSSLLDFQISNRDIQSITNRYNRNYNHFSKQNHSQHQFTQGLREYSHLRKNSLSSNISFDPKQKILPKQVIFSKNSVQRSQLQQLKNLTKENSQNLQHTKRQDLYLIHKLGMQQSNKTSMQNTKKLDPEHKYRSQPVKQNVQNQQNNSLIQKLNKKLSTYIDKNHLQSTYRQFNLNFSQLKKHIR